MSFRFWGTRDVWSGRASWIHITEHLSAPRQAVERSVPFHCPFCSILFFIFIFLKKTKFSKVHYSHQNFLPTYLFTFLSSNILRAFECFLIHFIIFQGAFECSLLQFISLSILLLFLESQNFHVHLVWLLFSPKFFFHIFIYFSIIKRCKGNLCSLIHFITF